MTIETEKENTDKKPRTRPKKERKQQLIDATIKSIAKNGIPGTTMTTVTSIAGLSLGLVNFHFESKQKLFEETLLFLALEHQETWQNAIASDQLGIEDSILAIVDAHFNAKVGSREKMAVWFAFYGDHGNRASYRRIVGDIDETRYVRLLELVGALKDSGDFAHIDTEAVARTLEAMFDGLWLSILIYPNEATGADAKRQIRSYLAAIFPGRFDTAPSIS